MPQTHLLKSQCHRLSHISENFVCSTTSQSCKFLPNKCALPSNKVWKCSPRFLLPLTCFLVSFPALLKFVGIFCPWILRFHHIFAVLWVSWHFFLHFFYEQQLLFTLHLNKTFYSAVLIEVTWGRSLANQHFKLRVCPSPLTWNLSNIHQN